MALPSPFLLSGSIHSISTQLRLNCLEKRVHQNQELSLQSRLPKTVKIAKLLALPPMTPPRLQSEMEKPTISSLLGQTSHANLGSSRTPLALLNGRRLAATSRITLPLTGRDCYRRPCKNSSGNCQWPPDPLQTKFGKKHRM
jgi:hypothetical protein